MNKMLLIASAFILAMPLPSVADSPGDTVSLSTYDYQYGVSPGNRVAVDGTGGSHFTWVGSAQMGEVLYNSLDSSGNWLYSPAYLIAGGTTPQVAVSPLNRAFVAFRFVVPWDIGVWNDQYGMVDPNSSYGSYFPSLSIGRDGIFHIFAPSQLESSAPPQYFRSSDGGLNWNSELVNIGFLPATSPRVVTSSPVSNKVAVAFPFQMTFAPAIRNDVYFIESVDGVVWGWETGHNVTQYTGPLYSSRDVDAIYDYNGDLHIAWTARNATDSYRSDTTYIFHYKDNGGINEVTRYEISWANQDCNMGAWNEPLCKLSLGISQDGSVLAIVYTRYDPDDCSASGYANGEVFCQVSDNNGLTWSRPYNLTSSPSPGCMAGNCDSDVDPSLAERIDEYLHIFYLNDRDAGTAAQTEGVVTNNSLLYLRVPVTALGIEDNPQVSGDFSLHQNYPNPFNARTTISFEIDKAMRINLSVYDITGARVVTLLNEIRQAGTHTASWDASDLATGVYFARLATDKGMISRRMVLLK